MTIEEIQKKRADGTLGVKEAVQELYKIGADNPDVMTAIQEIIGSSPEMYSYATKLQEQAEQGKLVGKIAVGANALLKAGFTAASLRQIASANNASNQLQRPTIPGAARRDPRLEDALNRARVGTIDVNQVLAPAKQGIQDAAAAGMAQAQTISRGQAGSYGSLANQINLQRMRSAMGLAPIAQEVAAQNAQIENQLLGQRAYETQNLLNNQQALTGLSLDQYNQDAAAVGGLGQAGRTNLYETANTLPQLFTDTAEYMVPQMFEAKKARQAVGVATNQAGADSATTSLQESARDFAKRAYAENAMRRGGFNWGSMRDLTNPETPTYTRPSTSQGLYDFNFR